MKTPTDPRVRWMAAVVADPTLTAAAKCVAAALAFTFWNAETKRCFPSYERLGAAACLKRRTAMEAVENLKRAGWIGVTVHPGRTHSNSYKLNFQKVRPDAPFSGPEKVRENARKVRPAAPKPYSNHSPFQGESGGGGNPLRRAPDGAAGFEEFVQAHPRLTNETNSRALFNEIIVGGEATAAELIAGAERYAVETETAGIAAVYGTENWLKQRKWKEPPRPKGKGRQVSRRETDPATAMLAYGEWSSNPESANE